MSFFSNSRGVVFQSDIGGTYPVNDGDPENLKRMYSWMVMEVVAIVGIVSVAAVFVYAVVRLFKKIG